MVLEPDWPAVAVSVAVHILVVVPQPLLSTIPELGRTAGLLLLAVTVSDPVPATVKETGASTPPSVIVCEPLAPIVTLGAAGATTLSAAAALPCRLAPSVAITVIVTLPT